MVVRNGETGEEVCRIESGPNNLSFHSAEFSPDGQLIVTTLYGEPVRTWDAKTGRKVQEFVGHGSDVHQAAFSADGMRIITASADGTVRLWNARTGEEIRRFRNPGPVRDVLLSPDGKRFLSKWSVGDVHSPSGAALWSVQSGVEIRRMPDAADRIVGFSPDGSRFVAVDDGKPAWAADSRTGEVIRSYKMIK